MESEFAKIKAMMADLKEKKAKLLSLTEITGGEHCLRENNRIFQQAFKIQKEIMRLNKKLLHLGNL